MNKKYLIGTVIVSASLTGLHPAEAHSADFEATLVPESAAAVGLDYRKLSEILGLYQPMEADQPIRVKYHAETKTIDLSAFDGVVVRVGIESVADASENKYGGPPVKEF